MKRVFFITMCALPALLMLTGAQQVDSGAGRNAATLIISSPPEYEQMAVCWAEGFTRMNPGNSVRVEGPGFANADFTIRAGGSFPKEDIWKMLIARDAIVPVISTGNPRMTGILTEGVAPTDLKQAFENPEGRNWSGLVSNGDHGPLNLYLGTHPGILPAVAAFTETPPSQVGGTIIPDPEKLIATVRNDPDAIAFCRLADLTTASGELPEGVRLLPIDRNANGRLDYMENIYENVADLSRGIWIGKFPKSLGRSLYLASPSEPSGETETAFLNFVLTEGQEQVGLAGFTKLIQPERMSRISRLPVSYRPEEIGNPVNVTQLVITIIAGLAILLAVIAIILRYRLANREPVRAAAREIPGALSLSRLSVPKGLLYDRSHTWVFMETDGTVRLGIDDFLPHVTGEITGLHLKKPGEKVRRGEPLLTLVQHGKRLTIPSPVSGVVIADNSNLFREASLVNRSPVGEGWIYRLEPTSWMAESGNLFMAADYQEWIRRELTRLKDFLSGILKPDEPRYALAVLQDGGEVCDRLLENMPPEVWEEFQVRFIGSTL